ncbi:hypothetical protein BCR44DRAFT_64555 [Catenaria anguillulae PL171]|uniref:Uncharacterized protein n=1 Tax=Catenaria anguillulae PL171 TaxID=765915 RepID=A0A1Y2H7H4_9FUNG|nr:hypothetical protein BCR44DRAFT_64555 [Catenaria anguillulae PL171]
MSDSQHQIFKGEAENGPCGLRGSSLCANARQLRGRCSPISLSPNGQVQRLQRYSIPSSWIARVGCFVAILLATAAAATAHDYSAFGHTDPPITATATRIPSSPTPNPPLTRRLHPRAEASGTHINIPPIPSGGFPPPPPPPPSTTSSRPPRTTDPFRLRPPDDDDSRGGQQPRPTGLDSEPHNPRDNWGPVVLADPRETTTTTTTTSSTLPLLKGQMPQPDPFANIWAPINIPLPGESITTFTPPMTSTLSQPLSPTAPTGPSISLPGQPTAVPTFSAIPIVPIGIGARTNSTDPASDLPLPNPNRNWDLGKCGNGYCSSDESCSTCPLDCSLAHIDWVLHRRAVDGDAFLRGGQLRYRNLTQYTFECGLEPVAQFCPRAPGSNRTSAMVAVTGQHPGLLTDKLQESLKGVPAKAVIVFFDMALLMNLTSTWTPVADAACDLVVTAKFSWGISLGSLQLEAIDGVSTRSLAFAAKAFQALPDWCRRRREPDNNESLGAFILNLPEPTTTPNRPLYISLDPGSAYRAAVLDPAIPPLLASFNMRLVVPSLPINEAHMPEKVIDPAETAAHLVREAMSERPGISGWIVNFDGSHPIVSSVVIPRVVQELERRGVQWVTDVSECLEYDAKAGAKRAAGTVTASPRNVKESKSQNPLLKPKATEVWAMDMSAWGAEVEAVSTDDSHMPGGYFS